MPEAKSAEKPKARRPRRTKRKIVEDTARSYFEATGERDIEAMAAHWADDIVEVMPGVGALRGPGECRAFFEEMFTALPDAEMSVVRIVADDDHAVVEWRLRGTFSGGTYQGIAPTGKRLELRGADVLEIQSQKIKTNTVYFDTSEFARQIGMLPPQDSGAERAMVGAFNAVTKMRRTVAERMGSR